MLKIKELSLTKSRGKVLQGISLEIPLQRISLLLGKSGSGKTSLLRCIAQLEKGYEGEITHLDQNLTDLSPQERCRVMGFVPQSYALFPHMTVLENCTQPLKLLGETKESASQKARQILDSLDIGLLASRKTHELSGGQQQRVAIARALVLNPSFLLLDEPTSALDPENTERLMRILEQLQQQGKGLIIATHDQTFAEKILDRAIFLENGMLIEHYDKSQPFTGKMQEFLNL